MAIRKKVDNLKESPFLETDSVSEAVPEEVGTEESAQAPEVRERAEEKISSGGEIHPSGRRSYWEFGLLMAVALGLAVAAGVLIFLAVKKTDKADEGKVSIQNISEEIIVAGSGTESEAQNGTEDPKKEGEVATKENIDPLAVGIKVLNGGSVGGSAGKMKNLLTGKGYKKVEASNSDQSNYVGVSVFYQDGMKEAAEKIAADIKSQYPKAEVKPGASSEEKSSPIVVILGK